MEKLGPILLVDDEENVLSGIKRQLQSRCDVALATSGKAALDIIKKQGEFAVVLSDMRMPGMDGVELLGKIRKMSPMTVRMMLTGDADQKTAVNAINSGNIFHFFNKPCDAKTLIEGIQEGITQYRLIRAEKELIETTLVGSIKSLTEVITLARPREAKRVDMMRRWAKQMAKEMNLEKSWELDLAIMLGRVGLVGIPSHLLDKIDQRRPLTDAERQLYDSVPLISADIIGHVPRLEEVSRAIRYQAKNFDGSGLPDDELAGADIPLGARVLKVLNGIIDLTDGGHSGDLGFSYLKTEKGRFDPEILDIAERVVTEKKDGGSGKSGEWVSEYLPVSLLRAGLTLVSDVTYPDGRLILSRETRLSETHVHRIKGIHVTNRVAEPIEVMYQRAS